MEEHHIQQPQKLKRRDKDQINSIGINRIISWELYVTGSRFASQNSDVSQHVQIITLWLKVLWKTAETSYFRIINFTGSKSEKLILYTYNVINTMIYQNLNSTFSPKFEETFPQEFLMRKTFPQTSFGHSKRESCLYYVNPSYQINQKFIEKPSKVFQAALRG